MEETLEGNWVLVTLNWEGWRKLLKETEAHCGLYCCWERNGTERNGMFVVLLHIRILIYFEELGKNFQVRLFNRNIFLLVF